MFLGRAPRRVAWRSAPFKGALHKVTGYNVTHLPRIIRSPDFRERLARIHAEREHMVLARVMARMDAGLERLALEREARKRPKRQGSQLR